MQNKSPSPFTSGALYLMGSGVALSLIGLLGKIGQEQFSLTSLIFWRYLFSFLLCIGMVKLFKQWRKPSLHMLKLHALRAFCILGSQYSFFYSVENTSLLDGMLWLNTGPLFIPMLEWIFWKRKISKSTWATLCIAFLGVVCILQPSQDILSFVNLSGFFSGLFQGASQVIFGSVNKEEKSFLGLFYLLFLCTLFSFIPYLLLTADSYPTASSPSFSGGLLAVGLGFVTLCNQALRAKAYQKESPSKLAVFLYSSVVLATIWDWLFFHNVPNFLAIIGGLLIILAGILKLYLRRFKLRK